jgi:hypothetical protein
MMETATISLLTLHSPKIIHQAKFLLLAQYTNQPYPQLSGGRYEKDLLDVANI